MYTSESKITTQQQAAWHQQHNYAAAKGRFTGRKK
jgi:hypothetical protein